MRPPVPSKQAKLALDYRPALFSRSGIARVTRELARALAPLLATQNRPLQLYGHGLRSPLPTQGGHPSSARLHRSRLPGRLLQALGPIGLDAWRLSGKPGVFLWTDYVYPPILKERPCQRWMLVHDLAFVEDPRFHGPKPSEVLRRRFEKALSQSDLILYPTQATRASLLRHYPGAMGDTPSLLLPFGLDHVPRLKAKEVQAAQAQAARLLGTQDPYLVILGTLEPRKNHGSLLQALDLLASKGTAIPLLVIGAQGWLSEELQAKLESQTPAKRASKSPQQTGTTPFPLAWTGPLPDAEVFPLLAGAAGLVYPSSLEGFGFPPLEALLLGTAVLAGDCPALRETLAGQPGALFAEGRDPEALAAKIPTLLRTPTGPCEDLRSRSWKSAARCLLQQLQQVPPIQQIQQAKQPRQIPNPEHKKTHHES